MRNLNFVKAKKTLNQDLPSSPLYGYPNRGLNTSYEGYSPKATRNFL